jgi:hypothetical protein
MAKLRKPEPVAIDGVPPELIDPSAVVWTDPEAHRDYMADRGYQLSVRDRLERWGESPDGRRRAAVVGWAVTVGITVAGLSDHADFGRLKAKGLLA